MPVGNPAGYLNDPSIFTNRKGRQRNQAGVSRRLNKLRNRESRQGARDQARLARRQERNPGYQGTGAARRPPPRQRDNTLMMDPNYGPPPPGVPMPNDPRVPPNTLFDLGGVTQWGGNNPQSMLPTGGWHDPSFPGFSSGPVNPSDPSSWIPLLLGAKAAGAPPPFNNGQPVGMGGGSGIPNLHPQFNPQLDRNPFNDPYGSFGALYGGDFQWPGVGGGARDIAGSPWYDPYATRLAF